MGPGSSDRLRAYAFRVARRRDGRGLRLVGWRMLGLGGSMRAVRVLGVVFALGASIATTDSRTRLSGSTELQLETTTPGGSVESRVDVSIEGHPVLTRTEAFAVEIAIVELDAPIRGVLELVDSASGQVVRFGGDSDAGTREYLEGQYWFTYVSLNEPFCADEAGCTRSLVVRLRDSSPTSSSIRISLTIGLDLHGMHPPPGAVIVLEASP